MAKDFINIDGSGDFIKTLRKEKNKIDGNRFKYMGRYDIFFLFLERLRLFEKKKKSKKILIEVLNKDIFLMIKDLDDNFGSENNDYVYEALKGYRFILKLIKKS